MRQFLVLARIRVCVHPQCEATEDGEAVRSSSEAQAVNAGENSRRVSVARALPSPNIDENAMLVLSALRADYVLLHTPTLSLSSLSDLQPHVTTSAASRCDASSG